MKNLSSSIIAGILLLITTSCNKTEPVPEAAGASEVTVYYLDLNNNKVLPVSIDLKSLEASAERVTNHAANGHYTDLSAESSFSAVSNPSGIHGEGTFEGGYRFVTNMEWVTSCLVVVNNQAYMGGVLTHFEGDNSQAPPFFHDIAPGWSVYQAVEDNGEGAAADPDKVLAGFFFAPPVDPNGDPIPLLCQFLLQTTADLGIPFINPGEPTNIQVR